MTGLAETGLARGSRHPGRRGLLPAFVAGCGLLCAAAGMPARAMQPLPKGVAVLRLDTAAGKPVKSRRAYVRATASLSPHGSVDAGGRPTAELVPSPVRVRGRGNTSWEHPKKPLRLKFDAPTDLLGAGTAETWVLLAN